MVDVRSSPWMGSHVIPYYFQNVDWQRLVDEYPPAPAYFDTVFRWPRERIEELQLRRLKEQVDRAWRDVPFYRRLWGEAGFEPGDLRSLGDLPSLPAYTVDDIRRSIEREPPLGDYQGVRWPEQAGQVPARVYFSGGTTGRERPTLYTAWDREVGALLTARALWLQGIRPGYAVINNFAFSLHNAAWIIDHALWQWLGCLPITASTGNVTATERQIAIAREYGVQAFVSFGDYLLHMASKAREMGLDPAADFDVRVLAAVGKAREVERAWGAPSYDAYGFHEVQYVAAETEDRNGLYIFEDAFIVEVVDSETGEPVADGELGDLVITCLYKTGSPQIRFNIKDLSRVFPPRDDGSFSTMKRMDRLHGRSDTMVKLRGINVWPEAVGAIVGEDAEATGEYFVVVDRIGSRDEMTCLVEARGSGDAGEIQRRLEGTLRARLGVALKARVVPGSDLAALTGLGTVGKTRRFQDRRGDARG